MKLMLRTSFVAVAAAGVLAGCGGGSSTPQSAPVVTPTVAPTDTPTAAPTTAQPIGPVVPNGSALSGSTPKLNAQQVSDDGLPSKVGPGKLSKPTLRRLMQYFEDKVSRAYAKGDSNVLSHYLAGPMLTGNRGTINLLNSQNRRNVFRIHVQTVKADANTAHRVILEMTGDMTVNYFFDPRTHRILSNGLPGPSQVTFTVFLDQNPKTGTWYWTGEKSGTGGVTGAQTVG